METNQAAYPRSDRNENNDSPKDSVIKKTRKNRSIARRLTLGLMLTVGLVSVIVVGIIYMYEVRKAGEELENRADKILSYQISALEIPLWNIDHGYINVIGKTISQHEPVASLTIKDHFGRIAYSMEKEHLQGSVNRFGRIFHNGVYVGEVSLSLTKEFYEKSNKNLLFSFILIILIILITIVIFSGPFIHLILKKPLDSLNRIVQAYASKEYEHSIHDYQPYIEFQPFSSVLAKMGSRITEQLRKLQAAEEKYRNIFENAIEGIFQSTLQGRFININPAMAHMIGYDSPGDVLSSSHNIATHFYVKPEDRNLLIRMLAEKDRVFEFETRLFRKDGTQITVSISARNVRDAEGIPLYFEGFMRNITEEKRLHKQAEYRLQQVQHADKLASLGEVVAGVAHEINNPNSFITCNAPLLEETWQIVKPILEDHSRQHPQWRHAGMTLTELCRDMKEIIQAIRSGSERINKIVLNLKDFVRIDNSRKAEPVNLNQVIEKTFAIIGTQVRKSVKKTEMDLEDNLPVIEGYFQKIEQVVTNLVLNAVHAIPDKEEGQITIRTRHLAHHGWVILQVEDNGTGMEPEVIDRIFEPFFTTRRNDGGTGLGLSVSYNLIKENNGIIGVLSRPGIGTCFTLFFTEDPDTRLELRPAVLFIGEDKQLLKSISSSFSGSADMKLLTLQDPGKVYEVLQKEPEIDILAIALKILEHKEWETLGRIMSTFPLLTLIVYSEDPAALEYKPDGIPAPEYLLFKPFRLKDLEHIIGKTRRLRL